METQLYDFKSVRFRRTREELSNSTIPVNAPYLDLYTFSLIKAGDIVEDNSDNTLCEYNTFKETVEIMFL